MKRNCSPSSSNALRSRPPSRKDCAPEGVGAAVRTAAPAVAAASRATQHRILVPPTQQTRKQSTDMSTELGSRTHPHTDGSRLPGATRGGRHACLAGRYTTGRTRPSCQVVCHTAVPSPPRSVPVHSPRNPSIATHVAVPPDNHSARIGGRFFLFPRRWAATSGARRRDRVPKSLRIFSTLWRLPVLHRKPQRYPLSGLRPKPIKNNRNNRTGDKTSPCGQGAKVVAPHRRLHPCLSSVQLTTEKVPTGYGRLVWSK